MDTSILNAIFGAGPKLVPFLKTVAIYFVIFPSNEAPSIFGTILKCLPIFSLMLFVLLYDMNSKADCRYARLILAGLFFCSLGDACLVWPSYFELGMVLFAIGHLNYILAFGLEPLNLLVGFLIFVFGIFATFYLLSGIQSTILFIGVPVYVFFLTFMIWRATSQLSLVKDSKDWNKICAAIGGVLFILSDSILGLNMFKFEIKHAQVLVMSSYYAAQLGIALSVVGSSNDPRKYK